MFLKISNSKKWLLLLVGVLSLVAIFFAITPRPMVVKPPATVGETEKTSRVAAAANSESDQKSAPAPATSHQIIASPQNPTVTKQRMIAVNNHLYPIQTYRPLMTPNDPMVGQWWVTNTNLPAAWDIPQGSHQTVLAMIDTGVALNHEEFQNRWYTNPGESGPATSEGASQLNCTDRGLAIDKGCNLIDDDHDGIVDNESGPTTLENPSRLNCTDQGLPLTKDCNRLDDDGNGYIDDYRGWDFVDGDNSVQAGEVDSTGSGTTHGTMTTGVAAATGNNGVGLAGVDWNTKILPIQALDDDSYGDTLSVGRAIYYAVSRGADVINLSLGSTAPDPYVEQAVQAAVAAGITVVAAAGNDGCNCMNYPANYPEVVAVGALNSNNQLASFSSWGQNLDILAPGTNINTSTWSAGNPTSAYVNGVNGTSFSAPIVSGLISRLRSIQPTATPLQLIAALTENTNRLGMAVTASHDNHLGFGTVDSFKATHRLATANSPPAIYAFSPVSRGDRLDPAQPADISGNYLIQQCGNGDAGGTPLYELKNGNADFFSISDSEDRNALADGYSSSLFSYVCLEEPLDTPNLVRNIDLFHEFKNVYEKLE